MYFTITIDNYLFNVFYNSNLQLFIEFILLYIYYFINYTTLLLLYFIIIYKLYIITYFNSIYYYDNYINCICFIL